ncbi:MAG: regulator of protease activity HflC (stomatin/prohibitin superfamily) [Luteibaculaceae bacterium]|jgi:regulator of protease activity HflC (stomatin/prohibitin superfamily)
MGPIFLLTVILIVIIFLGVFTVKQKTVYIIERFGKFQSIRTAGIHWRIPLVDRISGKLSMRIEEMDVKIETKTKDNVFVELNISVQFQVIRERIYDAFYELANSNNQIQSYVFDTIRAEVPKMKLDEVFENKEEIAIAIQRELKEAMNKYGFHIVKALVTDINPDKEVKHAMNKINAAERNKLAAEYEAEADKIRIVAKATAEAESKKLQGIGIANQRREIARGLEESVNTLNKVGISSIEASSLIIVTQHYDTLQAVGTSTKSNLILLPNSPATANNMLTDMITSMMAAKKLGDAEME